MAAWGDYQETVAQFFRELGVDAQTNQSIQGARTDHAIDVLVRSKFVGLEIMWIVECKAWNSAVPKEKVLALRTIVDDIGADRGLMMAENGYQSGALEAARRTNVLLTSLADLAEILRLEIGMSRLKTLLPRVESCRARYWNIPKDDRIDHGLRPPAGASGYSGISVINAVEHTLLRALTRGFPVKYDELDAAFSVQGLTVAPVAIGEAGAIDAPSDLFDRLHAELMEAEARLTHAEASLRKS